jgi:hypothetical protein
VGREALSTSLIGTAENLHAYPVTRALALSLGDCHSKVSFVLSRFGTGALLERLRIAKRSGLFEPPALPFQIIADLMVGKDIGEGYMLRWVVRRQYGEDGVAEGVRVSEGVAR